MTADGSRRSRPLHRLFRSSFPTRAIRVALLLALSPVATVEGADVVTRITDIGPSTQDGLNELDGAVLGGFLYFVTQPGDGTSLYRTNGTSAPMPVPNTDTA